MEWRCGLDMQDLCPVCGDQVSGYHYGLLTCESCKGFFKRTVQNNKQYMCAEQQACRIDKSRRKRCPSCRFQRCLHVGMRLEAVRADRTRGGRNKFGPMYKRDRALKQQRKALIQAAGFRLQASPPLVSSAQTDQTLTSSLQSPPLTTISHGQPALCVHRSSSSATTSNQFIKSELPDNMSSSAQTCIHSPPFSPQVPRIPQLVTEFLRCDPDELQMQNKISANLHQDQNIYGNHGKLGTVMCVMAEQTLFFMVDWARKCIFFRDLQVGDQMKLLHSCWSDLLVLDVVFRQVQRGRKGHLLLVTGQEVELLSIASHAGPTLASLVWRAQELVEKFHSLKIDRQEISCIRFLILFNSDVQLLEDHPFIERVQERVQGALLEYTLSAYSEFLGRFTHLLLCLSELRSLSSLAQDYLHCKHLSDEVPCSLLAEMLHAKRHCM
ncbi:steroidogenic factor 1b [Genypterus blacodes]|uniref:steroidogenic factor 1b n=1 Tax=Genypterus blacodes TaxID=154954 RepID=UPI003F76DCF1